MKKFLLFIFSVLLISNLLAQDEWPVVWSMEQMPFQAPQAGSEMGIVKAGFDTDEDGWGEFICAYTDLDSNFIMMYEASANDMYDLVWTWKYPVPANTFAGIAVGDMDNNGTVEIITTMPSVAGDDLNPPRLWVFEWNGVVGENKYGIYTDDTFVPHNQWNFSLPDSTDFRPYSLTIEDIDGDETNELIIGVRTGDRDREVMVASVAGEFSSFAVWQIEYSLTGLTGGSQYSVTTGDLDNDGNQEIHAFLWDLFTFRIIEVTGPNSYELVTELVELYPDTDYGALDGVRVADVNDDGVNEMYIAGTEPDNQLFIITDISDVSAITAEDVNPFYSIPVNANGKLRSMYTADPDGDGNLSLMIAGETNGQIFDLEYKGSGDPADSTSWELTVVFDIFELAAEDLGADSAASLSPRLFYGHPADDMDNDGKNEYVFVNYSTDFNVWQGDRYVWVIENGTATAISLDGNTVPREIALSQNYPNPFNPTTTISYQLPVAEKVTLRVFDMLGREVKTLVNGDVQAGTHTAVWNGTNNSGIQVASGVYVYKLQAGKMQLNKKMTLMR
jgi:hypothetical protein